MRGRLRPRKDKDMDTRLSELNTFEDFCNWLPSLGLVWMNDGKFVRTKTKGTRGLCPWYAVVDRLSPKRDGEKHVLYEVSQNKMLMSKLIDAADNPSSVDRNLLLKACNLL